MHRRHNDSLGVCRAEGMKRHNVLREGQCATSANGKDTEGANPEVCAYRINYFKTAVWNSFQSSRLFRFTASFGAAPSSGIPFAPRIDLRVPSSWI